MSDLLAPGVLIALLVPGLVAWGALRATVRSLRSEVELLRADLRLLSTAVVDLRIQMGEQR